MLRSEVKRVGTKISERNIAGAGRKTVRVLSGWIRTRAYTHFASFVCVFLLKNIDLLICY